MCCRAADEKGGGRPPRAELFVLLKEETRGQPASGLYLAQSVVFPSRAVTRMGHRGALVGESSLRFACAPTPLEADPLKGSYHMDLSHQFMSVSPSRAQPVSGSPSWFPCHVVSLRGGAFIRWALNCSQDALQVFKQACTGEKGIIYENRDLANSALWVRINFADSSRFKNVLTRTCRPIPPTSSSSLLPSAQLPSSHNPPPVSCQMPLLDSNTSHQIMDTNPDEEFSPNSYLLRACSGPQQASSSDPRPSMIADMSLINVRKNRKATLGHDEKRRMFVQSVVFPGPKEYFSLHPFP
ncbi:hypothetical protein CB1_002798012 [Camelus ferus]|nr:hypothetical protein CB1_002798012 [Camelus ferus]